MRVRRAQDRSRTRQETSTVARWRAEIEKHRERGVGPTAIHDHLRLHADDYVGSLSAVKRLVRRIDRERGPRPTDVAIRVETAPGEIAQVDFGYAKKRYDPRREVLRKSWVFVMTLGHSRHMFAKIVFDQKIETWIDLHVEAFEHFDGVPRTIVPDNLKAAVVRAAFAVDDDPVINRTYRELARHYGFRIDPTPTRSPEKKGKVERDVKYVKNNFLATWESVDIDEDNRQLHRVEEITRTRTHGTTARIPIDVFRAEEHAAMFRLPVARSETVVWKKARPHRDSHVQVNGASCTRSCGCARRSIPSRSTEKTGGFAIMHASHVASWSTVDKDLPEGRADLRHRSRSHWIKQAATTSSGSSKRFSVQTTC